MVCKNCGNETGGRIDCTACGYDPTKDDPEVKKAVKPKATEVTPPPIEIIMRKKTNVPAIMGLVCSVLMFIPIPFVAVVTCPTFFLASAVLTIIGFLKAKTCRSGRVFSIVSLILCILALVLAVVAVILMVAVGGMSVLAEIFAILLSSAEYSA